MPNYRQKFSEVEIICPFEGHLPIDQASGLTSEEFALAVGTGITHIKSERNESGQIEFSCFIFNTGWRRYRVKGSNWRKI